MKRYLSPDKRAARAAATAKRKAARSKLRPKHPRVHRYGFGKRKNLFGELRNDPDRRTRGRSACGLTVGGDGMPVALDDAAFTWLPREAQCDKCMWAKPRAVNGSGLYQATPLMLVTVETIILALARLGEQAREHGHRECYFRDGERCWCGAASVLDVVAWGVAAARWDPRFDHSVQVRPEDCAIEQDGGGVAFGNWCTSCLRVRGEWHRAACLEPLIDNRAAIARLQREHEDLMRRVQSGETVP